jgi:hypothetical protein
VAFEHGLGEISEACDGVIGGAPHSLDGRLQFLVGLVLEPAVLAPLEMVRDLSRRFFVEFVVEMGLKVFLERRAVAFIPTKEAIDEFHVASLVSWRIASDVS